MVRSRFGEVCSCSSLTALPGPAWVLLSYVLHTILCTSVEVENGYEGDNIIFERPDVRLPVPLE